MTGSYLLKNELHYIKNELHYNGLRTDWDYDSSSFSSFMPNEPLLIALAMSILSSSL